MNTSSNPVSAQNGPITLIHNNFDSAFKILFVGNSITYHEADVSVGWHNCCGMAASCAQNDYVHLTVNNLAKKFKQINYAVCDATNWEKSYKQGIDCECFEQARSFEADVIIMRLGENVSSNCFDADAFKSAYAELIDYLSKNADVKVVLTSCFWRNVVDDIIKKIAEKRKYPFVNLGSYGDDDYQMAIGKFENSTVAMHPSDVGMASIANDICTAIADLYKGVNLNEE